jgi:hypothetical protein
MVWGEQALGTSSHSPAQATPAMPEGWVPRAVEHGVQESWGNGQS